MKELAFWQPNAEERKVENSCNLSEEIH